MVWFAVVLPPYASPRSRNETYIADDSEKAANAFVAQVEAKFEPLLHHPGIGTPREQLAPGLRCLPYKNYCIYYVFDDVAVTIVRVVHGARDVRALF